MCAVTQILRCQEKAMSSWGEDDYWDDGDEPSPPQVPVAQELEGSVYMVPDKLWGFRAEGREDHPGACVRCDVAARLTFLNKGTDVESKRPDRFVYEEVQPSTHNGLSKPTAFALDPRRIRLHKLRNLHQGREWLGRLEEHHFRGMRQHFDGLLQLFGRGQP
jgi:hypothetical protein